MQNEHRVAYIYSKNLIEQINKVSKVRDRVSKLIFLLRTLHTLN